MIRRLILLIVLTCGVIPAAAQEKEDALFSPFHIGLRGGFLQNYHRTNANIFVGCPECGNFQNGKGTGFDLGFTAELPFNFFPRLELTLGAGYVQRGGSFGEASTSLNTILDPNSGKYVPLERQNDFSAGLKYIAIQTGLRFRPLRALPAYIQTELAIGLPLGSATNYVQTETILNPQGALYPETHSTARTVGSGKIADVHTAFGAQGTLGYEFPVSPFVTAAPEVSYYIPFGTVTSQFSWKVSSLRFGVAVRYNMLRNFAPLPHSEAPVAERAVTKPSVPAIGLAALTSEPLRIVETIVTETFPILPYVFFDSASSLLPDRFVRMTAANASTFKESNLPHRALGSYYEILNVIGSRMSAVPNASLVINGTTDGKEMTTGEPALALARKRANAVRDYLRDVWRIDPRRLEVTTSAEPHNPSSVEYPEGYEENRRVELTSDDDQLLKPIVHERFREETATPSTIPVALASSGQFALSDWRLSVAQGGRTVYQLAGSGEPPSKIDWKPAAIQLDTIAKHMKSNDSLDWTFMATSMNGTSASRSLRTAVSKSVNPFELSRLSLIVFDFDQAKISDQNRRMISKFVAKSLYPASTASIVGSTDNLGELPHNQELSEQRATNVHDLILQEKPTAAILSTKGIGPSNLLYDNSLPEGRYYCRTVKVEVETPIESVVGQ